MKNKKDKNYVVSDSLNPTEIITNHIRKILNDEKLDEYMHDIDTLEDLLTTETDDKYEAEEKKIDDKVDNLNITPPIKLNRENYANFKAYKAAKKEQYRKRLLFRALVKLAKRKGLWLVDEEEAIISHDKKKVTITEKR